ncbi:cystathionase, putative [Ixodes scapularis]|uniref:cystathionine gamma-lyase n=1 Tax=Ixodes scapularis TaxID=6945 RepID=B7PU74_IXOSC|nr:cystathionase, putative [Ixodes scapularis]|eukprot:XP_002405602.1 cystathionase, putative [Ixodes scapularis]
MDSIFYTTLFKPNVALTFLVFPRDLNTRGPGIQRGTAWKNAWPRWNMPNTPCPGDHIVSFDDVYGGTNRLFRALMVPRGFEITFVDATDLKKVEAVLRPTTKLVWIETPSNPTMKVVNIKGVCELVKRKCSAIVAVDNTFMSAYFQKPLDLGADISVHSLTKYMNGHSDVVMGAVCTSDAEIHERLRYFQNAAGAVPSPFDCFLVNRGLKTLHVRMERHMENGLKVAKFLSSHPLVEKVLHPGTKVSVPLCQKNRH